MVYNTQNYWVSGLYPSSVNPVILSIKIVVIDGQIGIVH
jgi:hypothetical protein